MKTRKRIGGIVYHVIVCGLGLIMIYPLVWMIMSSFKESNTIFITAGQLIPKKFVFANYATGWRDLQKQDLLYF